MTTPREGPNRDGGGAAGSQRWSLWSRGSLASIASVDSVGSIASVGSVVSIGSIGSAGSVLSVGSAGCVGSALSAASHWSLLSFRRHRSLSGGSIPEPAQATALLAAVAVGAALADQVLRRRRSFRGGEPACGRLPSDLHR